jgi:hypothetical protein
MARLPIPGRDDDVWGEVLNEFLRVGHGEDGTPRTPYVDARRYPHLKAAVDAIGAREETVLIAAPLNLGASDLTVPGNVALEFLRNGSLVVGEGESVTIAGPIVAGLWQIFDIQGSGKVVFGTFAKQAYPQWFGAIGDGVSDDTVPLNQVFAALTQGGTVVFLGGARFRAIHGIDVMYDNITVFGYGAALFMNGRPTRAYIPGFYDCADAQIRVWNARGQFVLNAGESGHEYDLVDPLRHFKCLGLTFENTGGLDSPYLAPIFVAHGSPDNRGAAVALNMYVVEDFEVRDCVFLNGSAEQLTAASRKGTIINNTWRNCNSTAITVGLDDVLVTGNVLIDVFQGFESGGHGKITNNYLHLTHRVQGRHGAGIWVGSGNYKQSLACEIANNHIQGYDHNSIQVVDEGMIPDAFGLVVIAGNIIKPADGLSVANGIYLTQTNGTYVIEDNVFDDADMKTDYQSMIFVDHYSPWGTETSAPNGTYVIRNNTGRFSGRHAETMISVPAELKATISGNDAVLLGSAAFRYHESSTCYRDMIRFIKWDNQRLTLCKNRLNGEACFVDKSSDTAGQSRLIWLSEGS